MSKLNEEVARIQLALKAPKGQWNDFGKYHYRNCEDILEALKPIVQPCSVTISDEVVSVGERIYVKAVVTISLESESLSVSAYARESLIKKGMDESQITGAASSYARKYALNGLFLIDDTKDADSQDNSNSQQAPADDKPWYNDFETHKPAMIEQIAEGKLATDIVNSLREKYKVSTKVADQIKELQQ